MTSRLPALKPKKVLRALQRAGFFIHHTTGAHYILKQPEQQTLRVTLPFHNKDLKRRTLESIIKQAGLTREDFQKLL
ncbi:type II toxin-antitoxin system HicA family toxin [Acidobacteria bacterium AH-259-O06]|nr:type II toxin-antitoxin system HicA family toxin [Acidobacteria bacterium AH-259-O06]